MGSFLQQKPGLFNRILILFFLSKGQLSEKKKELREGDNSSCHMYTRALQRKRVKGREFSDPLGQRKKLVSLFRVTKIAYYGLYAFFFLFKLHILLNKMNVPY